MRKLMLFILLLAGCSGTETTIESETLIICNATEATVFDGELTVLYDGFIQGVLEEGGEFYNYFVTISGAEGIQPFVFDPTNNDVERSGLGYVVTLVNEFAEQGNQTDCLELLLTHE